MELRPYQQQTLDKILWAMKLDGNDVIGLPTGSGKSHIIANVATEVDRDILILQPSKEILEQNVEKLAPLVDKREIGIFSASCNSKRVSRYTFATIGSIYTKPDRFKDVGLVLIDEAHLVNTKKASSMYMDFLNAIGRPKCVGLTATPWRQTFAYLKDEFDDQILHRRMSTKLITRTLPRFWNRLLHSINVGDLIDQGYLCPLRYDDSRLFTLEELKLNKAESDFDLDDYEVKLGSRERQIIEKIKLLQREFKSILFFCSSVKQAEKFSEIVKDSFHVTAKTETKRRDAIIHNFKTGKIQTVFNVGVLTTGFDHPSLDCIVLNRPTRSLALYTQMVGRGLRNADGKEFCTVVDFTGMVRSIGRIETVKLAKNNDKWDIQTETGWWHGRSLYEFAFRKKERSADRSIRIVKPPPVTADPTLF